MRNKAVVVGALGVVGRYIVGRLVELRRVWAVGLAYLFDMASNSDCLG